jgi:hypothetical protein
MRGNQVEAIKWRPSVKAISGGSVEDIIIGNQWRQSVEAISGGNQRPSARSHLLSQPAPLRRRIPTRLLELRLRLGARRLRLAQLRL